LDQLASNPLKAILNLIIRIIEDAYTATWGAWTEFFRFPNHVDFEVASGKLFWIPVAFSLAAVLFVGYFFKPDGYMASNEYYNGYWLNSDGSWDDKYFLSWKQNSTGWWVEDISGWWPQSQWLKIDGSWYYFDASGYMV
jgi:hypothetical protein